METIRLLRSTNYCNTRTRKPLKLIVKVIVKNSEWSADKGVSNNFLLHRRAGSLSLDVKSLDAVWRKILWYYAFVKSLSLFITVDYYPSSTLAMCTFYIEIET